MNIQYNTMKTPLVLLVLVVSSASAFRYNGTADSWAKYSKWNLCPHDKASLYFTFTTNLADGLLVYMDDGLLNPRDYMLLQLQGGKISLQYQFGTGSSSANFTRVDKNIAVGTAYSISIERKRLALVLAIATNPGTNPQIPSFSDDLCFGKCLKGLEYELSPTNSDMYIGGVPSSVRSRQPVNMARQFSGDIYHVEHKNCSCRRSSPDVLETGKSVDTSVDPCNIVSTGSKCSCGYTPSCQCLTCSQTCDTGE